MALGKLDGCVLDHALFQVCREPGGTDLSLNRSDLFRCRGPQIQVRREAGIMNFTCLIDRCELKLLRDEAGITCVTRTPVLN